MFYVFHNRSLMKIKLFAIVIAIITIGSASFAGGPLGNQTLGGTTPTCPRPIVIQSGTVIR